MVDTGIDISIFKPNSIRGTTSSKADIRVIVTDLLDTADWSSEGTLQCFYHWQDDHRTAIGLAILSSQAFSKATC